ncbi:MAG: 23S rRNA (pseudouridine(1915)-N(3))-methyltransferase RlmH, partial [Alistipes sp.]|nr:23S rRNA (pseudouridine(1915)-N(3))-methyltransferase RlmH [Alistipes sp.]
MNIELIVVGKTDSKEVEALVEMYSKRVNRYC